MPCRRWLSARARIRGAGIGKRRSQKPGERGDVGVLEELGRVETDAEPLLEGLRRVQQRERIEPELEERLVGVLRVPDEVPLWSNPPIRSLIGSTVAALPRLPAPAPELVPPRASAGRVRLFSSSRRMFCSERTFLTVKFRKAAS